MNFIAILLLLFAAPFWQTKAPAQWSDQELLQLLTDSPWAQMVGGQGKSPAGVPQVEVYLATAAPMQQAEQERERRAKLRRKPGTEPPEDPLAADYQAWLQENRATQIVVAVRIDNNRGFSDEKETQRLEQETLLRAGRKKFNLTGHFPPTSSDPYLRLAFPRDVQLSDKRITLELYVPGLPEPYRILDFDLKNMVVEGKLEL